MSNHIGEIGWGQCKSSSQKWSFFSSSLAHSMGVAWSPKNRSSTLSLSRMMSPEGVHIERAHGENMFRRERHAQEPTVLERRRHGSERVTDLGAPTYDDAGRKENFDVIGVLRHQAAPVAPVQRVEMFVNDGHRC